MMCKVDIKNETFKRGDIYYFDLGITQDNIQQGIRPCVIIQNDIGNLYSPTLIIAPITSFKGKGSLLPTHVLINELLNDVSVIKCEQPRTVSKKCIVSQKIGSLGNDKVKEINNALGVSLGLCMY